MNCTCGSEKCTGVCNVAIGARIFKLLNNVNLVESFVGDESPDNDENTLVVVGGQLYDNGSTSKILKSNIKPLSRPKISGVYGVDSSKCLSEFLDQNHLNDAALKTLAAVEDRRLVIIPFRPKTSIKLKVYKSASDGDTISKLIEVPAKVESVKWTVERNSDTGELEDDQVLITSYTDSKTGVRGKVSVSSYTVRFNAEGFEEKKPATLRYYKLLKMTVDGIFRPICINKGPYQFIVDNSNLYAKVAGSEFTDSVVIGEWVSDKIVVDKELTKKLRLKGEDTELDALSVYLKLYKNYIAPYGTLEENVIEMK